MHVTKVPLFCLILQSLHDLTLTASDLTVTDLMLLMRCLQRPAQVSSGNRLLLQLMLMCAGSSLVFLQQVHEHSAQCALQGM